MAARCADLPIGTVVDVQEHHGQGSYRAIVRGYDLGLTKYRLARQLWRNGPWGESIHWAFPSEVTDAGWCDPRAGRS